MSNFYTDLEINTIFEQFKILTNNIDSIVLEIKESLFTIQKEIFYIEINIYTLDLINISTNITNKSTIQKINKITIEYEKYETITDLLYDLSLILQNYYEECNNKSINLLQQFHLDFPYNYNSIYPLTIMEQFNNLNMLVENSNNQNFNDNNSFNEQIKKITINPNIKLINSYENNGTTIFYFVFTFNKLLNNTMLANNIKIAFFLTYSNFSKFGYKFFANVIFKNNLLKQIENFKECIGESTNISRTLNFIVTSIYETIYNLGEISNNIEFEQLVELIGKSKQYKKELMKIFKIEEKAETLNAPKGIGYKKNDVDTGNGKTLNYEDYTKNANERKTNIIKYLTLFLNNITAQQLNNIEVTKIIKYISSLYSDTPEIIQLIKITNDKFKNNKTINSLPLDDYQQMFMQHKVVEILKPSNFKAKSAISNLSGLQTKRIANEIEILKRSLPITKYASIYTAICKNENNALRFLVTGPANTPYANGLYIFDLTVPPLFPKDPPSFLIVNTGGDRCNPNLYAEGKVCLSILGTHHGTGSERWNPEKSTFYQILIAVQTQILVAEPYFNEPGWDTNRGTPQATEKSKEYNKNVVFMTLKNNLLDMFKHGNINYPEFKDVIKKHIVYYKEDIRKSLMVWEEFTSRKAEFIKNKNELFKLIDEYEKSNNTNETSNNTNEKSNNTNEKSNNTNETSNNTNETSNNTNETSNNN